MESKSDIAQRLIKTETTSEFAAVFQPVQQGAVHYISTAEMNRTVTKSGPLRVAAYIRVSSDSSDQENSYETQDKYFSGLLSKNPEWTSAGVYSDYGISGTDKQHRTGYKRLLRHCREGKIDRIVCKSISRFARNTSDFMTALNTLHDHQVTILFEKEGLDTADPTNDFILTTLAAIAQEESRSISSNIRWGNQKRYPKGQARNYDIYGYCYAKGEDAFETMEDGYQIHRVEIVEEEAAIVRRIFQEVEDGERYSDIARRLNYEHIPAPDQGKAKRKIRGRTTVKEGIETGWTSAMISRMITLERYCGDALLQKTYTPDFLTHKSRINNGEMPQYLVRDHHPAIISREQFERVQKVRQGNAARFGNRGKRTDHPFSGRLICAHCGRAFNIRNASHYPIWFCPTSALNNGKGVCHAEKIYEEQAVRMFRKAFTDRFHLLSEPVLDDVTAVDILSGRYGEEESPRCHFDQRADRFVEQIRQRLVNIQKMDFMERDRGFLKRQIEALKVTISEAESRRRILTTQRDTLGIRKELLNDAMVDGSTLAALENRIQEESDRIRNAEKEKEKLEQRLSHLESYWEQLEAGHEERDRALEWIETLPEGQEGTVAFLNGLTSAYVKAFALSITVHDPLHYTVHWFDDTSTDVEMYSNVEDYRCTAAYFDGQRMREKYRRKG
ncbi:MAG TPA: recombinase family protein [Candidatus Eisenbergiella intestinigallinarum]|uniref:Recombinase family protein n=1 Tax=Candidatus Eisenbergiella intestinigallinarum TaxID=2838549 RepID=A0A9D2TRQ1_9FIRM|nr:recombinase family protein [Candidatus Eisenbergiella intestinigallinarum]